MNNIKAKLAALFTVACCCLGCLGVGVSFLQPKNDNVTAKAATQEELAAEFTNNGQFTVSQATNFPSEFEFVDGDTEEGLPEGYDGAVLKISECGDGHKYVNVALSHIPVSDVKSITVRCYSPGYSSSDAFRIGNNTNTPSGDMSTWCDIELDATASYICSSSNGGTFRDTSWGLRDVGTVPDYFYIDSITIETYSAEYEAEFTNNGQFTVERASHSGGFTFVDGTAEGLPTGYEGAVLKVTNDASDYDDVRINFSKSKIKATDVQSVVVRCYATPFTTSGSYLDEFRTYVDGNKQLLYATADYNLSTWFDVVLKQTSITDMTDAEGYLAYIDITLRDKDTKSQFYIDSITVNLVEYTVTEIGTLTVHGHSAGTTTNTPKATALYLKTDTELPYTAWSDKFNLESGDGWKLNGNAITPAEFISAEGHLYANLTNANVQTNDVLSVSGTFVHATEAAKYVIEESKFVWNGTTWEVYVEYTTYNFDGLTFRKWDASKNHIYLDPIGDWERPDDGNGGWTADFVNKNGAGIMFGEKQIATARFPGDMFIELGAAPAEGDVLTIGGTFYNSGCAVEYVIPESKFVWNGTTWEAYEGTVTPDPEYQTYEMGKLSVRSDVSKANMIYGKPENYALTKLPFNEWNHTFVLESGDGLRINGQAAKMIEMQSPPDGVFFRFDAVTEVGTILSIGGTFTCDTKQAKYVIEESTFIWNGTSWENYVEYTVTELGALTVHGHSAGTTTNTPKATALYLKTDAELPYTAWSDKFNLESGDGWKLNGNAITPAEFISAEGHLYANLTNANVQTNDVLSVSGTFVHATENAKYVIPESKFVWTGATWEVYIEYTTCDMGALKIHEWNSNNNSIIFLPADDREIPVPEGADLWNIAFLCKDGVGVTLNGEAAATEIKFPNNMFITLSDAPKKGDALVIDGTFYNETYAWKYVVEESKFVYNGTAWEAYEEKTVELGKVVLTGQSISSPATNRLYLKSADGIALELYDFAYVSGTGVVIDDVSYNEDGDVSTLRVSDSQIFRFYLNSVSNIGEGTVITVGGTFRNAAKGTTYVIEDSTFLWNGTKWINYVATEDLEAYDIITIQDIGLGAEVTWEGTTSVVGRNFVPSEGNTTNSLAFRFGYNCEDTALDGATLYLRFRGSNWQGILIELKEGKIYLRDAGKSYALESNTDYVIEIGAISMKDGKVWTYVKLDEVMVLSEVIATDQFVGFDEFAETGFTNYVSIYTSGIAKTTITDPDGVAVKYVSSAGTHVEKVKKDQLYTLATGKSEKVFIAWEYNGELYAAGQEFGVVGTAVTFTAVELDFTMEGGASIRLNSTADYSGIRFTSRINEAEWQAFLKKYEIVSYSYGTLIMPYDYLGYGQAPNLDDFVAGEDVLKIETENGQSADGYFVMRGAMQKIHEGNYGRLFAGRAYIEITLANGTVFTVYTAFDNEDNVRSIRQVAKAFKADTSEPQSANELRYHTITDEQRTIVDAYIGENEIRLMNYDAYKANATPVIAWNFPALDSTNNYMNDANIAVATTMKEAGIRMIGLTGDNIVRMDTPLKIEKTRQIINFFWSQGIYTFAYQSNGGNKLGINFAQAYPDFSDCEGFIGFLAWDEPSVEAIDTIATQVKAFEAAYAGTDVTFMGNLLPSYASIFNTNGALDKDAFKAYLQKYCDVVLSQVSGEKWLSIDTYPIYADQTLLKNFLFDIGTLKTVALENEAHAHVILQSYGYNEDGNTLRDRMPSEAELRMQAYTAMAFGVDSMSWFVYSPNGSGENDTAVDVDGTINQDNYDALKNINAELTAISKVYNAFDWKGIILGAGKDNSGILGLNPDKDYKAFEMVMGQLGDYELSASDTKHLSSVNTDKTDWNYLMGVMEDAHGNEGYVLCNYNSHEKDRTQTITLTFDSNITEAVIYRGGVAQTVSVKDKTLTVTLEKGEGVIILPSKLN